MNRDFYLDERWLASYFEKDWFDHVSSGGEEPRLHYPKFDPKHLYSDYHEKFAALIERGIRDADLSPSRLLEVGSSLGRTFYEVCKRVTSVRQATLVEPSGLLSSTFKRIFQAGGTGPYPVLYGNGGVGRIHFESRHVKAACSHVDVSVIEQPFQDLTLARESYDLVICSNVIDQCKDPMSLLNLLKDATAPAGVLVLSCSYQWQEKYLGNLENEIRDFRDCFAAQWEVMAEENIPFSCRRSERHWLTFLAQAVVLRKKPLTSPTPNSLMR